MKSDLLSGTAAALIFGFVAASSGQAHAQATPDVQSSSDGSAAAASDAEIRDIIVTARRRDERLQDVPIAVSAVNGLQAERMGLTDTQSLVIATPNLDFGKVASYGALPFLRGVGTSFGAAGVESPVAIYVDDVYISSPNGNLMSLNNIESVQVLKGPQGTLFGRNATGGVIQITTKQPSFAPEGRISVGYGNYDTYEGALYASTGLSDTVAVSIAASGRKQSDGFGKSLLTGEEVQKGWDWNVRGKLLANLGERTSITLSADYSKQKSDIGANQTTVPGSIGLGGYGYAGEYNTLANDLGYTSIR